MNVLRIDPARLVPPTKAHMGVFSFVAMDTEIEARLRDAYGRFGLCLKVFKNSAGAELDAFHWGKGSRLVEATRAQNLVALHGLAPRVYDLVRLHDDGRIAQVTDFAQGDPEAASEWDPEQINAVKAEYGLDTRWDMNPKNFVGSKLVDFQQWRFADPQAYQKRLIDLAFEKAAWGSRSEPYQAIERLQVAGQRDQASRERMMRLDGTCWVGRDVLDIGCNLGAMGWAFAERYCRRYIGVDLPHVVQVARELANWLGYFNLDFLGLRLPGERQMIEALRLHPFDVVLALSVDRQVGYDRWMAEMCADVFYLEGHVPDQEATYRERLERDFAHVTYLGMTRDHGPRPLFQCYKEL